MERIRKEKGKETEETEETGEAKVRTVPKVWLRPEPGARDTAQTHQIAAVTAISSTVTKLFTVPNHSHALGFQRSSSPRPSEVPASLTESLKIMTQCFLA